MRNLTGIPTTAQTRALESSWIKQCANHWGQVLMEVAGKAAAQTAFEMWQIEQGKLSVFCGRGNNGGDGMVVARYLHLWGVPVCVHIVNNPSKAASAKELTMSSPEANANKNIVEALGIPVEFTSERPASSDSSIGGSSIIVDALLGTGTDRPVEGAYKALIDAINDSGKPVLAIDLPSGINSDSGQVMGSAIRASRTVTFGYLKPGLLCHPGAALAGDLSLVDIGLPETEDATTFLTTGQWVLDHMPKRPDDSNKGTFGSVLVIAGSLGMAGATILCSESALRSGAGLVLLAAPRTLVLNLPAGEVVYRAMPETKDISLSPDAIPHLKSEMEKARSFIVGPGMSQNEDTVRFLHGILPLLQETGQPCLLDADALNCIAQDTSKFPKKAAHFVLTPHPKELSRLTGQSVAEIQADRLTAARLAAKKFGCTVVLKGSRTVIACFDGRTYINPSGNAGMATAGAGDVLSGIIGGLMAQGMESFEAAVAGVYIHGTAGDVAAHELGEQGTIAGDISEAVPLAIKQIQSGECSPLEEQLFRDVYLTGGLGFNTCASGR